MDEGEKKEQNRWEEKGVGSLKVTRRGFLKGMGTGTVSVALTGVPLVLPPEAMGAQPKAVKEAVVQFHVNAASYRVKVKSHWTLLDVLRRQLGLTGTKKACNRSSCGACTVIIDGMTAYACSLLAIEMDGKKILTVEGLAQGDTLHPVQRAFSEYGGYQCGYCTSGQMMSAKALLDKNPKPDREAVREGMAGNLCRCGAYPKIVESVLGAAVKG